MDKKLRIAAFGAHPDDLEYLVFGTLIKYRELGHEVHLVIATDGRRGGRYVTAETPEIRRKEAIASAAHLGITPVFLNFEDGRLACDSDSFRRVVEAYDGIKPDVVFTHSPTDYHSDHRNVSRLVTDASWVPVFYFDNNKGINFNPQFYVDVTEQYELKKTCLREHVSQEGDRLVGGMEVHNMFRAMQCTPADYKYAEGFCLFQGVFGYAEAHKLLP